MSETEYQEADSVKELAAALETMLKDESRWKMVGDTTIKREFQLCQPEYYAWKLYYMRNDIDDVSIDYDHRSSEEPRLIFRGKRMDFAARLGKSLQKVFRELAYPLHEKLYWRYRAECEGRIARDALNGPVFVEKIPRTWWEWVRNVF